MTIVSTCEQGWCGAQASQSETLTDDAVGTYGVYWVAATVLTQLSDLIFTAASDAMLLLVSVVQLGNGVLVVLLLLWQDT